MKNWVSVLLVLVISLVFVSCRGDRVTADKMLTSAYEGGFEFSEIQRQSFLHDFLEEHPIWTEYDKINYLLSLTGESDSKFYRNGYRYKSSIGVKWLKRKLRHKKFWADPIYSAEDFIRRVATRSNTTGEPYQVILPDGKWILSKDVLMYELNWLDLALRRHALKQMLEEESLALGALPDGEGINSPLLIAGANPA